MSAKYLTMTERLLNMNEKARRNDDMYVTFLGLPENVANFLGRQVKNVTRPTFEYMTTDLRFRGATYKDKQNLTFQPITISFYDDESALTSTFLYMQLYRQQNKHPDKYGHMGFGRDYKFDIKVEMFDSMKNITESFIIKRAFLQSLNHSDPSVDDDSSADISVTFEYDNIDILLFDEYVEML